MSGFSLWAIGAQSHWGTLKLGRIYRWDVLHGEEEREVFISTTTHHYLRTVPSDVSCLAPPSRQLRGIQEWWVPAGFGQCTNSFWHFLSGFTQGFVEEEEKLYSRPTLSTPSSFLLSKAGWVAICLVNLQSLRCVTFVNRQNPMLAKIVFVFRVVVEILLHTCFRFRSRNSLIIFTSSFLNTPSETIVLGPYTEFLTHWW